MLGEPLRTGHAAGMPFAWATGGYRCRGRPGLLRSTIVRLAQHDDRTLLGTVTTAIATDNGVMIHAAPRVYFARAIDGENDVEKAALVSAVTDELSEAGLLIVDPVAAEPRAVTRQTAVNANHIYREIVEHDLAVLQTCDAVLMDMSKPNRNYIGCMCELMYAYRWHIPCIVYISEVYRNRAWLVYHATAVFESRRAAISYLSELMTATYE
jgi:nucleoside 2-deoxyribosyltransferase